MKGRHLIEIGMQPGPPFRIILEKAYEFQLNGMSEVPEILQALKLEKV